MNKNRIKPALVLLYTVMILALIPCVKIRAEEDDPHEELVRQMYANADGEGLIGWTPWYYDLKSSGWTGYSIARHFVFGGAAPSGNHEFVNLDLCNEHFVRRLYKVLLGRTDETIIDSEVTDYAAALDAGMTREEVFDEFVTSGEFRRLCAKAGIDDGLSSRFVIPAAGEGTVQNGPCQKTGCGKLPEGPYDYYYGKRMSENLADVNRRIRADAGAKIADLLAERTYTASDVLSMIRSYSFPNKNMYGDRWDVENVRNEIAAYMNTEVLSAAPGSVLTLHYGILTDNASVRAFPSDRQVRNDGDSAVWDYFQETKLLYGDGVIILHQTADSLWSFVQGLNYFGWVRTDSIGICSRDVFLDFLTQDRFLVRTYVTLADTSPLNRMGVILPVKGKTPDGAFKVILPVRVPEDGTLTFAERVIGGTELSTYYHEGFLDYSPEAVVQTARTMLGYPYGYGDLYNYYDCSSFAGLVYRCFGVFTPRNSGDMPHAAGLTVTDVRGYDDASKTQLLTAHPGAIIGWPGHVMMSAGGIQGDPGRAGIIHENTAYYNAPDGAAAHFIVTEKTLELPIAETYGASGQSFLNRLEYIIWLDQ